ncbi:MAG: hypothetical protein Ct9H300mP7_2690 [Verrucomicrobiota bacterium]|nr:MAG: hypothetical protein Ct9H300mP7_2690 [Verrucomicrobiota bacterium]
MKRVGKGRTPATTQKSKSLGEQNHFRWATWPAFFVPLTKRLPKGYSPPCSVWQLATRLVERINSPKSLNK